MKYIHPYDMLKERAKSMPEKIAFGYLKLGSQEFNKFQTFNWKEVCERVDKYAQYFRSQGLKTGDRLAILAKNRVEWVLSDWAAIASGIVTVPLYPQSTKEEITFILNEAEVRLLVSDKEVKGFDVKQVTFAEIEEGIKNIKENFEPSFLPEDEIVTIIYTSGTTGEPKGVMHTAENLGSAMEAARSTMQFTEADRLISYLPLSHVVERMLVEFGSLYTGCSAYFVDRIDRISTYLPMVRPTLFVSVPRIWDMISTKINKQMNEKKAIAWMPKVLKGALFGPVIRKKLGLDQCRFFLAGAAKLHRETFEGMKTWGIYIHEGYGLTETLCISTMNVPGKTKPNSVGKVHSGVEVKIQDDGEICLKADFHFKGYYKRPKVNAEVLKEGWFHTGDIGHVDEEGFLHITDRKKDIFKTSNGKYISPLPIEGMLKSHPAINEVMVIGDGMDHCVAFASVNEELANETDLIAHLDGVNSKLPPHEQIKSLGCCLAAWSTETGELTPSQKLKRKFVIDRHSENIKSLYADRKKIMVFQVTGERGNFANADSRV